jgi:hypothetical protein
VIATRDLSVSLIAGGTSYPLQMLTGSIDMDESMSPFVGGNITVAHPGPAVLALMNPVPGQKPPQVSILAKRSPGGQLPVTLSIQARQVVVETGEVGINLVNNEALVQDYSPSASIDYASMQGSVRNICQAVLTRALGATTSVGLASGTDPSFTTYRDVQNLIPGGSFEVSSGVWGAVRADLSISTAWAQQGSYSLRMKPNATGAAYAMLPVSLSVGSQYTMTAYIRTTAAQTGTLDADARRLRAVALVNGVEVIFARSNQAPNTANTTTKLTMTFTVPAGSADTQVRLMNGATNAADNSVYFDCVMLVEGDGTDTDGTPLAYFDGNTADTTAYNYDWTDVAGLSTSTRTALVNRSPDALIWQPGTNGIAFLQPILQATGRRLFQDLDGIWRMADNNYRVPGQVRIGPGYGLYSVTDLVSRTATQTDGLPLFADAVILNYVWTESGTGKEKAASDIAGPTNYTRPYMPETIQAPFPGPGRAAYMLSRLQARQRQLQVRGTTNYAARPGQEAVITTADGGVTTGYVDAVIWDLGDDSMQVVTKGLLAVTPGSVGNAPSKQTIGSVTGTIGNYAN